MNNNDKINELHNLMHDAKLYSLPISCTCGYKSNTTWIEMENHYLKCGQYRQSVKILMFKNKNNKK
jgi:hypothetical protein